MWFTKQRYQVLDEQESKPFTEDDGSERSQSPLNIRFRDDSLPRKYWKYVVWLSIANFFVLLASTTLFISWYIGGFRGRNALLKATSFYSPVLDYMDIAMPVKKMNATLYPGPNPGFARQMPNPEAEAVWDELETMRTIPITKEQVLKLGKDPETVAKFEDDYWHLGEDAYMAQFDLFHQMHCLNQLRKLIYPEYYNYSSDTLHHPDLCGNTDLYTMNWMETQGHPFPDFNLYHQCRDFDTLVDWRKENAVDVEMWINMKKPAGVNEIPPSEGISNLLAHEHAAHGIP